MPKREPGQIRTIAFIGHGDSGKTTLVEGLLFAAGAISRQGAIEDGTTVSDNPLPLRAGLRHALEECLDQAIYLQRAIEELDNAEPPPRQKTIEELMKPYLSPQLVDFKPTNYQVEQ